MATEAESSGKILGIRLEGGPYLIQTPIVLDGSLTVSALHLDATSEATLVDARPTMRRRLSGDGVAGMQPLMHLNFSAGEITLQGFQVQHAAEGPAVEVVSGIVVMRECSFANNTGAGAVRITGGHVSVYDASTGISWTFPFSSNPTSAYQGHKGRHGSMH